MERINPIVGGSIDIDDDEMSRQSDTCHWAIEPARDLDVDHGKRDWDAEPPRKNSVQTAIPRVVVVVFIAPKVKALEEQSVGCQDEIQGSGARGKLCAHLAGEAIQACERSFDIETRK